MQKFRSIMSSFALKTASNKSNLWSLYASPEDDERIFTYENLRFRFEASSPRTIELAHMSVYIPRSVFPDFDPEYPVVCERFLLALLSPEINALSDSRQNAKKEAAEKGSLSAQLCGPVFTRRSGCLFSPEDDAFIFRLDCRFPLTNGTWINPKAGIKIVASLMALISSLLRGADFSALKAQVALHRTQRELRAFMREHSLCAFVADGSLLPRAEDSDGPMPGALPFRSPDSMRMSVALSCGSLSGMAVRRGVTVITGGGYSGKSTLLDALEAGIYDHIPGDGRELCLTDPSALKICAEDGRPVGSVDLRPFFGALPGGKDVGSFSTPHASGSVSQAAGIVEAVCGGCRLLLIDEDRGATNFMIRDAKMRRIVKNDPITPFTDRVRELFSAQGVSTVLVIGGSGEYLSRADAVILMDGYAAGDITAQAALPDPEAPPPPEPAVWQRSRRILPRRTGQPFLWLRSVRSENEKKIILDDFSADITNLTALSGADQLNTLARAMETLLTDAEADGSELADRLGEICRGLLSPSAPAGAALEEIRPLDALCCINRMRGARFAPAREDGIHPIYQK